MTPCRLLLDPPCPGAWNMALDEVLLEQAAAGGGCCWRFYRWVEPTLSLGYFQQYEDRFGHAASRDCALVRRASGGGAILHDRELTYSLVAPAEHPLAIRRQALYTAIHTILIDVLSEFGIAASLHCEPGACRTASVRSQAQPFLCFLRRSPGDVVVGGTKIAGSAQRRSQGAVLQHGSLILARSPAAPELAGLADLAPTRLPEPHLLQSWLDLLATRLGLEWRIEPVLGKEQERAARLVETQYGSDRWNRLRKR